LSKLVHNYTANGSSTTDEYGTQLVLNRFLQGDVVEGFAVVANGTPNLTVLVQPGSGRITTGTYPSSYGYLISHDTSAGESVTISTPAASPRIDYIVAYIDKAVAGSTSGSFVNNTNNVLKFAAVAGTPSGSPVVPTVGQIQTAIGASNPYVILAQIAVAASVSTITNPNITDLRSFIYGRPNPAPYTTAVATITPQTGAFSNATASVRYKTLGKTMFINLTVNLINVGTGSGNLIVTLPLSIITSPSQPLYGRETALTGKMLQAISASSTTLNIFNYDNTVPMTNGYVLYLQGTLELA
jgi:hypothetical protein